MGSWGERDAKAGSSYSQPAILNSDGSYITYIQDGKRLTIRSYDADHTLLTNTSEKYKAGDAPFVTEFIIRQDETAYAVSMQYDRKSDRTAVYTGKIGSKGLTGIHRRLTYKGRYESKMTFRKEMLAVDDDRPSFAVDTSLGLPYFVNARGGAPGDKEKIDVRMFSIDFKPLWSNSTQLDFLDEDLYVRNIGILSDRFVYLLAHPHDVYTDAEEAHIVYRVGADEVIAHEIEFPTSHYVVYSQANIVTTGEPGVIYSGSYSLKEDRETVDGFFSIRLDRNLQTISQSIHKIEDDEQWALINDAPSAGRMSRSSGHQIVDMVVLPDDTHYAVYERRLMYINAKAVEYYFKHLFLVRYAPDGTYTGTTVVDKWSSPNSFIRPQTLTLQHKGKLYLMYDTPGVDKLKRASANPLFPAVRTVILNVGTANEAALNTENFKKGPSLSLGRTLRNGSQLLVAELDRGGVTYGVLDLNSVLPSK